MESSLLSSQKREVLIQQINRRMAKLPDEALIELEELTRQSHIKNSQAESEPSQARAIIPAPPQLPKPIPDSIARGPNNPTADQFNPVISRRGALLLGTTGIFALITTSGMGWFIGNNNLQDIKSQIRRIGGKSFYLELKNKIDQINNVLDDLLASCHSAQSQKESSKLVLADYQARISPTSTGVSELQAITSEMKAYQDTLNEGNFIQELLGLIMVENWLAVLPVLASLGTKAKAFYNYVSKIPVLITASEQMVQKLQVWFAENDNINTRFLQPLQVGLFNSVENIHTQASNARTSWKSEVAASLSPTVNEWQEIRDKMD